MESLRKTKESLKNIGRNITGRNKMIGLNLGKWSSCNKRVFKRQRIYFNGYHWTPFVWITPRYLG